jgi:hypothetical protein
MATEYTPGPWHVTTYGNIGYEIGASKSIAVVNRVGLKRLEWLKTQPLTTNDGSPWPGRAQEIAELEASGAMALANARIMAAAPELLAALEAYQAWSDASERAALSIVDGKASSEALDAESAAVDEFHRLRDAALAKAKGA